MRRTCHFDFRKEVISMTKKTMKKAAAKAVAKKAAKPAAKKKSTKKCSGGKCCYK